MRYETDVAIDLPRERVVALVMDPALVPLWQKECVRRTLVDGEHGQPGAKTEVVTQMNGREMTMIETITCNDLPNGFSETYETAGVWNSIDHHFEALDDHRTRWCTVNEFRCSGLMMKFMMLVAPGMFKRQTQTFLNNFKAWAETYEG